MGIYLFDSFIPSPPLADFTHPYFLTSRYKRMVMWAQAPPLYQIDDGHPQAHCDPDINKLVSFRHKIPQKIWTQHNQMTNPVNPHQLFDCSFQSSLSYQPDLCIGVIQCSTLLQNFLGLI